MSLAINLQLAENARYLLVVQGRGEGCDYCLNCNIDVVPLRSQDPAEAWQECRAYVRDRSRERIHSLLLYEVDSCERLSPEELLKTDIEAEERRRKEQERQQDEAELARLKAKLGQT